MASDCARASTFRPSTLVGGRCCCPGRSFLTSAGVSQLPGGELPGPSAVSVIVHSSPVPAIATYPAFGCRSPRRRAPATTLQTCPPLTRPSVHSVASPMFTALESSEYRTRGWSVRPRLAPSCECAPVSTRLSMQTRNWCERRVSAVGWLEHPRRAHEDCGFHRVECSRSR